MIIVAGEIRALNWKQPFASLMLHGKIETRTWDTKYRGFVLICASKKEYTDEQLDSISGLRQTNRIINTLHPFNINEWLGKAIAIGRLVDCRPMRRRDEDKCFVKYRPELYCHIYEDVDPIEPIEWIGAQKWKKVSEEIMNSLQYK